MLSIRRSWRWNWIPLDRDQCAGSFRQSGTRGGNSTDLLNATHLQKTVFGNPINTMTQLERFFTAKIARIEAPASEDAGKPMAGKVPPFQPVE